MKAALALIAISTLNALTASPAPGGEFRPAKNAIAEATHTRLVELPMKAGFRRHRGRADSTRRDFQDVPAQAGHPLVRNLKFTHLTTNDVILGSGAGGNTLARYR
jgi:hypothetical protein